MKEFVPWNEGCREDPGAVALKSPYTKHFLIMAFVITPLISLGHLHMDHQEGRASWDVLPVCLVMIGGFSIAAFVAYRRLHYFVVNGVLVVAELENVRLTVVAATCTYDGEEQRKEFSGVNPLPGMIRQDNRCEILVDPSKPKNFTMVGSVLAPANGSLKMNSKLGLMNRTQ